MNFRGGVLTLLIWPLGALATNDPYKGVPAEFSVERVEAILKSPSPPAGLDELIGRIQQESPTLFENFVLMYRSKSFQASSAKFPRVLVFNTDASFIMSFNGHPSQRGYDRLEMIQFRKETARFELREVRATPEGLRLSEANPKLCVSCHQSPDRKTVDPRPNWEPYSRWPGAIGSEQEHISLTPAGEVNLQKEIYRKEDAVHIADAKREREILAEFVNNKPKEHARYRHLKFTDERRLFRIATDLTDMLGRLNFHRVMRVAREDAPEHFEKVKHLFAGVARCGKLYANEPALSQLEQKTPSESGDFVVRGKDMIRNRKKTPEETLMRADEAGQPYWVTIPPAKYPNATVSEGLYLLFEPFGVDISDWSMDFRTSGRLAFIERFGLPSSAYEGARNALFEAYPEMGQISCDEIEKRAAAESDNLLSLPVRARPTPKPLINACIRCHVDYEDVSAPYIPFDDAVKLKFALDRTAKSGRLLREDIQYRLSDHATLDEQMPMGLVRPSSESRRQLIEYIQSL